MSRIKSAVSELAIVAGLALSINTSASADIVHLDDVIIDGSLCVGQDCVNGESFGFDTLRLKENNLRIHFQDTSNSASFPTNDWRIVVNDSSNGGSNHFSIEDSSAGRSPFRIEAGAPANSLVVEDAGRIGIGTATPVVEMHVVDGDTPTLRLEQDGSSGFTPQIFDVAANETNFFIRDASNGSTLPFRIRPGAPSNSLYVHETGRIGVGTTSPDVPLDVQQTSTTAGSGANSANTAGIRISSQSGSAAVMALDSGSNGEGWRLLSNSGDSLFRISKAASGAVEFTLDSSGNLTLSGGIVTASGNTCAGGCDEVFADDYELPSISDHADYMLSNRHLMHVGPTAESGPFNLSEKVGGMLSELEYAHLYIYQLHQRQEALEQELARLAAEVD